MAITNAQQYQQLVNKRADGKRPGYRGDDAARSSEGTSGGRADPGGAGRGDTRGDPGPADDRGTAQQNANQRAQVRAAQVRAVENLINRPPVGFTDAARINLFNYSPTSLAVKGIKNLGTAIANSKIGQFMNAKQREAYLDSLDTDEQVAALEALGKIGIGTTNPMGIDRNITRGTEKGIFGTNIGGGQFITDPNLGSVEAKTALGTGYQDYLDDITSRFDNTDGGDGGQTYIPPVLTPYQEDVVEEVDPNSLQGLLANRIAYRLMADGGRAGFQQGSPAPIAPRVDPRMAKSLQENIATNEAQRTANITRKEAQRKAIEDIRNAISSGGKEGLGSFLQQQFGVANPSQVPGYSSYSSPLSGVSSFAKDKITNALIQNYLNPSAQGSSSVYDQMRFAAPGQSGSFVEMEGGQFGNGMGIVIDGKQYATEQDAIDDVGLERYNMFYADGGRVGLMGGGMPDDFIGGLADGNLDEMGRQMYGLGKLVKKATRAVKKIVKSPVGKAALLYAGTGGLGNLAAGKGFGSMFSNFLSPSKFLSTVPGIFTKGGLQNIASRIGLGSFKNTGSQRLFEANKLGSLLGSPLGMITAASALSGLMTKSEEDENENEEETYYRGPGLDIEAIRRDPYGNKRSAYRFYADGGDVKEPVAKDTMPLLDMNGMEKDYRADGGFVPIGRMERADDVPARLSKNEFVFTADAVRNAGDGDVDKGAEVMYNMMKNLESGGKVSEESQGLDGARDMFQTSKRLEEVL